MNNVNGRKSGFTLVEVILAVSISVLVFAAMGAILGRCFSLWKDATARWKIAQYAQISRQRILHGGFADPQYGLMSATNTAITDNLTGWDRVDYGINSGVQCQVWGWSGSASSAMWLYRNSPSAWTYAQGGIYALGTVPDVISDRFSAYKTNDLLMIECRFRMSAGGKTYAQPYTIRAYLPNEVD